MMTLFSRSGSLAALAVALAFSLPATPAAAQDYQNGRGEARQQARAERQQARAENRSAPARVQIERAAPQRAARVDAPRPERAAAPRPVPAQRAERAVAPRPAQGGFGGDVAARVQAAQRANGPNRGGAGRAERIDRRSEARADQVDRRSERRAETIDRRSEQRADRVEQRGDIRAGA